MEIKIKNFYIWALRGNYKKSQRSVENCKKIMKNRKELQRIMRNREVWWPIGPRYEDPISPSP